MSFCITFYPGSAWNERFTSELIKSCAGFSRFSRKHVVIYNFFQCFSYIEENLNPSRLVLPPERQWLNYSCKGQFKNYMRRFLCEPKEVKYFNHINFTLSKYWKLIWWVKWDSLIFEWSQTRGKLHRHDRTCSMIV